MKKICLLLAAIAMMTSCDTIRIVVNSSNNKGERQVMTSSPFLYRVDGHEVSLAMAAKMTTKDTIAALVVTCDAPVKLPLFVSGQKMKFHLNSGDSITLTNILHLEYESTVDTTEYTYYSTSYQRYYYSDLAICDADYVYVYDGYCVGEFNSWVSGMRLKRANNSYAIYPITHSQLCKIVNTGVDDIQMDTNVKDLNMYYTGHVAELMKNLAVCLVEGIYGKNDN